MKKQLKIAVENGGYAQPKAVLVELEITTNILICSTDSGNGDGTGTEAIEDGGSFDLG